MEGSRWRSYPPLSGALVAALLAVFVLPSALNVPQSNPTQTLEFAPVPPVDEDAPPPPQGNTASLGLGSSSTAPGGDAPGGDLGLPPPPPPPIPEGEGQKPVTKRCVMTERGPRQTEDPLAPPCVAHFEGDNGGATWKGVGPEEVRVLLYFDGAFVDYKGDGYSQRPTDVIIDLSDPQQVQEHDSFVTRIMFAFQNHFNRRYQTYGRAVRFSLHFDDNGEGTNSPEGRRADAIDGDARIDPFAALAYPDGFQDDYLFASAGKGVMNFGSFVGKPAEFYTRHPGLIWSYLPSIEQQSQLFSDHVCTRVVPYPVSAAGDEAYQGRTRRVGMLSTTDGRYPGFARFAQDVEQRIRDCGADIALHRTFPVANSATGQRNDGTNNESAALGNVAAFQQEGVTTVVWPQGFDPSHTKAAGRIGYRPEWVIAGDGAWDSNTGGGLQDQQGFDRTAWVVTARARTPAVDDDPCMSALVEAAPEGSRTEQEHACTSFSWFEDLRQLFTGIQVAGPKLTPESLERGFRAIPAIPSGDPTVPACFYDPGDYTCVKDGVAMWWDATYTGSSDGTPGCWRYPDGGKRYFEGEWPQRDLTADRSEQDPCSFYDGSIVLIE